MSVANVMRGDCVWCGKIGFVQHPEWVDPCCHECAEKAKMSSSQQIEFFDNLKYDRLHNEYYVFGDDCPRGGCE